MGGYRVDFLPYGSIILELLLSFSELKYSGAMVNCEKRQKKRTQWYGEMAAMVRFQSALNLIHSIKNEQKAQDIDILINLDGL
jgi:hypothetical protein